MKKVDKLMLKMYNEENIFYMRKKMKLSTYNLYIQDEKKYYVFNTWKGSLVSFEEEEFQKLQNNEFDYLKDFEIENLKKLGVITNIKNEFLKVSQENNKSIKKSKRFSITIAPTFRCNAKCPYCFEKGIVFEDMDKKTINSTVDYIVKQANGKVHITWFGGEPLLGSKTISEICKKLSEKGVNFSSSMITNGFLIDENYEKFTDWKLKRIQVTLDGLKEKYNAIKGLGDNAFDKVVKNIHLALKNKINVSVRINFNSSDYSEYKSIIRFLFLEFGNKIDVYFHDIVGLDYKTPNEFLKNPFEDIYEELINFGYIKTLKDMRIRRMYSSCAINKESFINVCPNGEATKCEHYVGRDSQFSVGNINDAEFSPKKKFTVVRKECENCKCFPMCGGGCYSNNLMRNNSGCIRIKSALEKIIHLYIRRFCNEDYNK